jgi:hypothetical protein
MSVFILDLRVFKNNEINSKARCYQPSPKAAIPLLLLIQTFILHNGLYLAAP